MNKVCVMLASYNGVQYIEKQIDSILEQTSVSVELFVRDDGSADGTLDVLKKYERAGKLHLIIGDGKGPASNFYELLHACSDADYYSWSDQDDIWDKEKLQCAIEALSKCKGEYRLYFGNEDRIDKDDNQIEYRSYFDKSKHPMVSLPSTIISNQARGATMVFSHSLRDLMLAYKPDFKANRCLHDAWLNMLCQSVGGDVVYDLNKHMKYRIHNSNVVARNSYREKIKQFFDFNSKIDHAKVAEEILLHYFDQINTVNREVLNNMVEYKKNIRVKTKLIFSNRYKTGYFVKDLRFRLLLIINKA